MAVSRREWWLEADPGGWTLHYRRLLSPFRYAPSHLPQWTRWVFWPCLAVASIAPLLWLRQAPLGERIVPSVALTLWMLALWLLPTRLSPLIGASYVETVRPYEVQLHRGKFDVPAGQFDEVSLLSLRLEPLLFTDRVALVFDGQITKGAVLLGWPGLPVTEAESLREELLAMIHSGNASSGL